MEDFSQRLEQIQAQLDKVVEGYTNLARTYYNMFYNNTPMDITLRIFDETGALKEITVPNRAKDAAVTLCGPGDPRGRITAARGALYLNTDTQVLWYNTAEVGTGGWQKLHSESNWEAGKDYLVPTGSARLLTDVNADEINIGVLSVRHGGTGTTMLPNTLLKGSDEGIIPAEPGKDYLDSANLTGMIVYFPGDEPAAGYLVCDGAKYNITTYQALYDFLDDKGCFDGPNALERNTREGWFRVPNMAGLFVRSCVNTINEYDIEPRSMRSIQLDGAPNVKGTWAQEITGAEASFTGAIKIATDDQGRYVQVDGSTSAPAGAYDYLIEYNAANCSDVYRDDLHEIRVKNIALLPAIKY